MPDESLTPQQAVDRCQRIMSHAWMVRTFVKHSEEVEEFPELMHIVRAIFDTSRALETRIGDPPGYLKMLRKKIGKLRRATSQFRTDAAHASSHTNFKQAVASMHACVDELELCLERTADVPTAPEGGSSPPSDEARADGGSAG